MTTSDGSSVEWSSAEQVAEAITAAPDGTTIRVRGSGHSFPRQIRTPDSGGILASLDPTVALPPMSNGSVKVWGGTHLGPDPRDARTTPQNTLLPQLHQRGYSLADTGGIIHQTVGGFLSTGSTGGTVRRPLDPQITAIELVDGTGELRSFERTGDPGDPFYAAGVSLGLLGVITGVTFEPEPKFSIVGQEAVTTVEDCEIDLFGPGSGSKPSLQDYLTQDKDPTDPTKPGYPYTRLTWWPQPGVDRIAVWKAQPVPGDVAEQDPYEELGYYFDKIELEAFIDKGGRIWGGLIAGIIINSSALMALFRAREAWLEHTLGPDLFRRLQAIVDGESHEDVERMLTDFFGNEVGQQFAVLLYFSMLGHRTDAGSLAEAMFTSMFGDEDYFTSTGSTLVMQDLFLTLDSQKTGTEPGKRPGDPQPFQDYAYNGLPMDNQISDDLMPTEFTELWVPIEQTQKVMQALQAFYAAPGVGYQRSGTYACEIYAAAPSDFWLSPSSGTANGVVRIDLYYFRNSSQPPDVSFYPQFWDLLGPLGFRPHWGKYLPPADGPWGADYLRTAYAGRIEKFLELRQQLDPRGLFLTDYWRQHLGITDA